MVQTIQSPFERASTLNISDSHGLHPDNFMVLYHAAMTWGSNARRIISNGDTLDFEALMHALRQEGYRRGREPLKIAQVLDAAVPRMNKDNLENSLLLLDVMMAKAAGGAHVEMLTGNHDIGLDVLDGEEIEGIHIAKNTILETADRKKYFVNHGHLHDQYCKNGYAGVKAWVACRTLDLAFLFDQARACLSPETRESFAMTKKVKALGKQFISDFKQKTADDADARGMGGVINGHIHVPSNELITATSGRNIHYLNSGNGITDTLALAYSAEDGFIHADKNDIPAWAMAAVQKNAPWEQYRPRTMAFLQTVWDAQLEYMSQKGAAKEPALTPALITTTAAAMP